MKRLKTYLQLIDNSDYDFTNENQIIQELKDLAETLKTENKEEAYLLASLNIIALSIQKSFSYIDNRDEGQIRGLSYQAKGVNRLEDGTEKLIFFPDVTKLTDKDFRYFEKRYKETSNLYLKVEYGLPTYFGAKTSSSKHLDFKRELVNNAFQLSKTYYAKKDNDFSYMRHSGILLEYALGIASDSKHNFKTETKDLSKYITDIILNSDLNNTNDIWITATYTTLLLENFTEIKEYIEAKPILEKNFSAAKEKEKDDYNSALFITDICLRMAQRAGIDKTPYLTYKAQLLERTAIDYATDNHAAAMYYIQQSLLAYKELKMQEDVNRIEKYYEEIRGQVEMSEFTHTMSDEHTTELFNQIEETIADSSEEEIIKYFIATPWFKTIEEINDLTKNSVDYPLSSLFPTDIIDKFGNTVARYSTDEERQEFRFWSNYGTLFQLSSQTMFHFFTSAINANKLSYQSVISYLESTWFNEPIKRKYAGQKEEVEIKPIDILKPGLKRIFSEFELVTIDNAHYYDTITIIDSLTLKIESLLRYFCEQIGIPTFKHKEQRGKQIFMEKLLDDLLSDVADQPKHNPNQATGFDEEDRIMLKYVLVEKAGINLRNKVAHGLMDESEYSFMLVVILFSLILKLSKYKFTEKEGGQNESNN